MTPVFQTIISKTNGNCMQAAYASILDMDLDDVPNFTGTPDNSRNNADTRVNKWLKSIGLSKIRLSMYDETMRSQIIRSLDFTESKHFLASVPSQAFDCGHLVVCKMSEEIMKIVVAHDPNPNNKPYDLDETLPIAIILITKLV